MMIKQKLSDVAADLSITNKELIELLSEKMGVTKKNTANLTPEELNYIFEYYTKKKEVKSFDAYFATQRKKEEKPAPKPSSKPDLKNEDKAMSKAVSNQAPLIESKSDTRAVKPQGKNSQTDSVNKPPEQKKPAAVRNQPQVNKFAQQPQVRQPKPVVRPNQPAAQKPAKTQEVVRKVGDGLADTAKKNVRHVDTRSAQVELDKYNERYEQIAPGSTAVKDNFQRKQKITQKSAQKGKPMYSRKETEAEKLKRLQLMQQKKHQLKVMIPDEIVVSELAVRLKQTAASVIKKLMTLGVMTTANEVVDFDTASLVAMEFGAKVEKEIVITIEERLIDDSKDQDENLYERSPIVVVMGHVDHGKTSLLDAIRNTSVTSGEAGGITQHIGAYKVKVGDKNITFLDTPGHAAFTSMRARGAQVTDIAILVVAADDGIMPQTVEAINHAKAAGVSIIVAINKMDKPSADPDRIKQGLTEYNLVPEEWGGDIICVPVSALKHENIDTLLETVLLVAEVKELKANPNRLARGTVIEARLDKGRGPIATILIQNGTLKQGDVIIAGTTVGRVRAMVDDKGNKVMEAGPSTPVEITGLAEVPSAGDIFNAVEDEKLARELVDQRKAIAKEDLFKQYEKVTLDNIFSQIEKGDMKELNIIVKADVQGSVEALRQSLEKITNDEVVVKVIHGGVGAINDSDVMLAKASNAIIVGFNVRPDAVAAESAERDGVDMRMYRIIYDCIEEIESAMKGMLAPKYRTVELGKAEVRIVYKITNVGVVAGCYVLNGKIQRNAKIRVVRDGIVITEDDIDSLKRFKDDVKEVASGYECGIGLDKFSDIKEGDILEAFTIEEYRE